MTSCNNNNQISVTLTSSTAVVVVKTESVELVYVSQSFLQVFELQNPNNSYAMAEAADKLSGKIQTGRVPRVYRELCMYHTQQTASAQSDKISLSFDKLALAYFANYITINVYPCRSTW